MEENYNATSRNGHESQDMYDPKKTTARKIVYVDMGGVLMDFHAGLELIGDELRKEYAGRYSDVPHIVSYLPQ